MEFEIFGREIKNSLRNSRFYNFEKVYYIVFKFNTQCYGKQWQTKTKGRKAACYM
mgnify:CR=1 FL=1